MTPEMLTARLAEATRQYQGALEKARRIRHIAEMTMTPIESAPLLATVDQEVEEYKERMETAFVMARGPGCSVMGDK